MSYTELRQSLRMNVRERGAGQAIAVVDYGAESELIWVVVLDESGEIWCARNSIVRMRDNWTLDAPRSAVPPTGQPTDGQKSLIIPEEWKTCTLPLTDPKSTMQERRTAYIRKVQANGSHFVCPKKDRTVGPTEYACSDCYCISLGA